MTHATLGIAEGTIQAGEPQQERLEEVISRIQAGEFHNPVTGKIPYVCIDGRPGGECGPCSAGGTFTFTIADDLTSQHFSGGKSLVDADRAIVQIILASGGVVGGHCDNHASGENCGCGAKDRIEKIYDYLVRRPTDVRAAAESLGVEVSDELHERIIASARQRTDFSSGAELSASLKEVAGEAAESVLRDTHAEVVVVINTRKGTTLDREALAREFGENYQAFNVDVWSFTEAAKLLSDSDEEAAEKAVAMVYYNLATGGVLCGPDIRVAVVA